MTPFLTDFETYPEGYEGARYALFVVYQERLCVCENLHKVGKAFALRQVPGISPSAFKTWPNCIIGRIEDVIRQAPDDKEAHPMFSSVEEEWLGTTVPHLAVGDVSLGLPLPGYAGTIRSVADVVSCIQKLFKKP